LVARNNLLLAQQSGDGDKIEAAVSAMLAAGYKAPYIRSTLQGEQGDQACSSSCRKRIRCRC
jgi:hypothetical protein